MQGHQRGGPESLLSLNSGKQSFASFCIPQQRGSLGMAEARYSGSCEHARFVYQQIGHRDGPDYMVRPQPDPEEPSGSVAEARGSTPHMCSNQTI